MDKVFKTGDWYHYRMLPEHEKVIYMHIYRGVSELRHTMEFPVRKYGGAYPTGERIVEIMLHVVWDNPRFFYFDATNVTWTYTPKFGRMVFRLMFTDYFSGKGIAPVEQALLRRAEEILREAEGCRGEYERLVCIGRHLARNVRYMEDAEKRNTLKDLEARTVIGPLLNRRCVCAGYAKAFKLLCDQLGICCFYVRGQGLGEKGWGNHGWNAVYLQGRFYHVDVTFDSLDCQRTGQYSGCYFLRSDEFMAKTHRWDRQQFPAMPDDYVNTDDTGR